METKQPFKINPPSAMEHMPLSKTAVETKKKWGLPATPSDVLSFDHTKMPFRRHGSIPTYSRLVNPRKFSSAGFSIFREIGYLLTPYYIIEFKNHRVLCPSYKWLVDYLCDYFFDSVGASVFYVPYGKYLWSYNVLHRFPQKKLR